MGAKIFDQYSLLHFASGVIAYFWGVSFHVWMVLHVVFELIENTKIGMMFINYYFKLWPGGKDRADSFQNSFIGDNVSAAIGWIVSKKLDDAIRPDRGNAIKI